METVCRYLSAPIAAVVKFALVTGWRVHSEILPLTWAGIDEKGRTIRLEPGVTKNQEARSFPFTTELETILTAQKRERDRLRAKGRIAPWVFHRNGKRITTFISAWRKACAAAGCPGRMPHDLRRSAVRTMERAGVPRTTAMKFVGHKTESVYRRYAIVDEAMQREAASLLDAYAESGHTRSTGASTATGTTRNA